MSKNTNIILSDHFDNFIATKINAGRFSSKSDAIQAGMRLLEEHEQKVDALRATLAEGEASGISQRNLNDIVQYIKQQLTS